MIFYQTLTSLTDWIIDGILFDHQLFWNRVKTNGGVQVLRRQSMWNQLCRNWHLQAGVEKLFFKSGDGIPPGHRVVEVSVSQVFVHELSKDAVRRKLIPATALQALEYALANPRAQFVHPLIVCGSGANVDDQHGKPQIIALSCMTGMHAMFIRRQGERLSDHARLLVLEPIPVC